MKVARFVLKIVGWSLALAAAVCCVVPTGTRSPAACAA